MMVTTAACSKKKDTMYICNGNYRIGKGIGGNARNV